MKQIQYILFLITALAIVSCTDEYSASKSSRLVSLSVNMPGGEMTTRVGVSLVEGSKDLSVSFSADDKFSIYVRQGDLIQEVEDVTFAVNSENGKQGTLAFQMPASIDISKTYTLYGICGVSSWIRDGRLVVDDNSKIEPSFEFKAPVWFEFTGQGTPSTIQCEYIGTFIVIHVDNLADTDNLFQICGIFNEALYEDLYWDENTKQFSEEFGVVWISKALPIAAGKKAVFIYNGIPNGKTMETLNVSMHIGKEITWGMDIEAPQTPKNVGKILEQGRAYHVYLTWDGKELKFSDGGYENHKAEDSKIVMTTAKMPGEQLQFGYFYGNDIWFDMNNNGVREWGEYPEWDAGDYITFQPTVQSQTFTIYGNITGSFDCGSDNFDHNFNRLTSIDMSEFYGEMLQLFCAYNELNKLILPKAKGTALNYVWCERNHLTEFDASDSPSLSTLFASNNRLVSVKLPSSMWTVDVHQNPELKSLDLSGAKNLYELYCWSCSIESLELPTSPSLWTVDVQRNSSLKSIDVSGANNLHELHCQNCNIESLNLSQNPVLAVLLCDGNSLTSLDLSANHQLLALGCNYNSLDKEALETIYRQLPDVTNDVEQLEQIMKYPELFRMLRADHNPGYNKADQTIATRKGWEFEDKSMAGSRILCLSAFGGQR